MKFALAPSMLLWTGCVLAANTSDERWQSGWGQGPAEAKVTHGSGNEIAVACDQGSGFASSISFALSARPPGSSSILVIFDHGDPINISVGQDGRIVSDTHVGDANFRFVIQALKTHHQAYIRFADGRESTFSLSGAAKAIGDCKSSF